MAPAAGAASSPGSCRAAPSLQPRDSRQALSCCSPGQFTDEEDYKECVNELSETTKPSTNLFPELEYPLIAVVWIESDHDRSGPCGICCVDFIEKKEFDK